MENTKVINSTTRLIGRVKWFNNKSGFGFITVSSNGEYKNKEIFVHYSSIRSESSKYKYLVQGEYVEFILVKSINESHEYHASDISGIQEGILMCDTHGLNAVKQTNYNENAGKNTDGFTEIKRRVKKTNVDA